MQEIINNFVARLYLQAPKLDAADYRQWALSEVCQLMDFDAGLWGKGSAQRTHFHTVTLFNLDTDYAQALEKTANVNPMLEALIDRPGEAIDIRDLLPGAEFQKSRIYKRCFRKFGVEQVLSTAHVDTRSGLSSLISFYRFDKERGFTESDRQLVATVSYHLSKASTLAFFLHLLRPRAEDKPGAAAVIDKEGHFHEVEPGFLDLLDEHFENRDPGELPFRVDGKQTCGEAGELAYEATDLDDLLLIRIRQRTILDQLTRREKQVVQGVCSGMSHKEIGRELGLAPTTVSSHLYRAYEKLGVTSRAALTRLVRGNRSSPLELDGLG